MSEFIIAVIVISVVLMVVFKARKKSVNVKSNVATPNVVDLKDKPIVKPLESKAAKIPEEPVVKAQEAVVIVEAPQITTAAKVQHSNIQIPQDSTLRRHALNHLHSILESCKENRPTDSSLSRHYDNLVEVILSGYTQDADEILCLMSYYQRYFKTAIVAEVASVKAVLADVVILDTVGVKSTLPEDSTLRRHALQLSS